MNSWTSKIGDLPRVVFAAIVGFLISSTLQPSTACAQFGENTSSKIDEGYGKSRGKGFVRSVNGTSVFANMFREAGHRVRVSSRLSPRLKNFDTVVWFNPQREAPSEKLIERLETWAKEKSDRVLIVVLRDFDAAITYRRKAYQQADDEHRLACRRQLALTKNRVNDEIRSAGEKSCQWYSVDLPQPQRDQAVDAFSGHWADLIDAQKAEIYTASKLTFQAAQRAETRSSVDGEYEVYQVLLETADHQPLIAAESLETNFDAYSVGFYGSDYEERPGYDSEVILVANGSMLLNLPLVNSENRIIAQQLIERCLVSSTLFIETPAGEPSIVDSIDEHEEGIWSFLRETPLCYILPQAAVLGILFCFVYFPIFGRPKTGGDQTNTNFFHHIQSAAMLLKRKGDTELARKKIAACRRSLHRPDSFHSQSN